MATLRKRQTVSPVTHIYCNRKSVMHGTKGTIITSTIPNKVWFRPTGQTKQYLCFTGFLQSLSKPNKKEISMNNQPIKAGDIALVYSYDDEMFAVDSVNNEGVILTCEDHGIYSQQFDFDEIASYYTPTQPKQQNKKETPNMFEQTLNKNKTAAYSAAHVEIGKTALTVIKEIVKKSGAVPALMSGYLDRGIGSIALANILSMIADRVPNQPKMRYIADYAMYAAYLQVADELKLQDKIADFLGNGKIMGLFQQIPDQV